MLERLAAVEKVERKAPSQHETRCTETPIATEKARAQKGVAARLRLLRELLSEMGTRLPTRHRQVEPYICFPIGEELRRRLEDFLKDNPDVDEETAYALLLERGVWKTEDERDAEAPRVKEGSMRPFPKRGPPDYCSVAPEVTINLGDELRDRLEAFIVTHPGDVESAITSLIGVGLDTVKKDPGVFDPARVFEEIKGNVEPSER